MRTKVLTSKGKALASEKQLYDELFDMLMPHLADLRLSAGAGGAGCAGKSG